MDNALNGHYESAEPRSNEQIVRLFEEAGVIDPNHGRFSNADLETIDSVFFEERVLQYYEARLKQRDNETNERVAKDVVKEFSTRSRQEIK